LKDLEKDVATNKALVNESEQKRTGLQQDLQKASHRLQEEQYKAKQFADEVILENRHLRDEIAQLKVKLNEKETERLQMIIAH
jgi:hypothetical protein